MTARRVPVVTVAEPGHGPVLLEGESYELLPPDRVYVNPRTGGVRDGRSGHKLHDLSGDEIEIPRTTWY